VNLPKQQQLKELLTHRPLGVTKHPKEKWQREWGKTIDAFDGAEIGLEQLLRLKATEVISRIARLKIGQTQASSETEIFL
jgi:hypothetical protein